MNSAWVQALFFLPARYTVFKKESLHFFLLKRKPIYSCCKLKSLVEVAGTGYKDKWAGATGT